jgi:hypothetical protein
MRDRRNMRNMNNDFKKKGETEGKNNFVREYFLLVNVQENAMGQTD